MTKIFKVLSFFGGNYNLFNLRTGSLLSSCKSRRETRAKSSVKTKQVNLLKGFSLLNGDCYFCKTIKLNYPNKPSSRFYVAKYLQHKRHLGKSDDGKRFHVLNEGEPGFTTYLFIAGFWLHLSFSRGYILFSCSCCERTAPRYERTQHKG